MSNFITNHFLPWLKSKSLAEKYNLKHGECFILSVDDYKCDRKKFWDELFNGENLLREEEANELNNLVNKIRNEYGFRMWV